MTCLHEEFEAFVRVNRLEHKTPMQFTVEVRIECVACKQPFKFIGLPYGLDLNGAAVSPDGTEGRFAIAPRDQVTDVSDSGLTGFTIRKSR